MLQKCTILGLVLLLAGGSAFAWLYREMREEQEHAQSLAPTNSLASQEYIEKYGRWHQLGPEQQNQLVLEIDKERKSKTSEQLGQEQQARLRADLDKLAAGQMNPGDIADFLYGRGWEDQVEQYKKHNEQMETAQTVSIVCLSIGGLLFGGCALFWLLWLVVHIVRVLRRRSPQPLLETESPATELMDLELEDSPPQEGSEVPVPQEQPKQRRKLLTRSEAPTDSRTSDMGSGAPATIDDLFHRALPGSGGNPTGSAGTAARVGGAAPVAEETMEDSRIAVLFADDPSDNRGWSPQAQWSLHGTQATRSESGARERHPAPPPSGQENGSTVKNPLKEQADTLQKQIAGFKQATREQAEPLSNTLKELTQQVSAIREYAASQQDRVEKLQDGYDWGIIRTFCLRVIRCIDNLEGRLDELPKADAAVRHLEEVRDELLFALESSGVEQFQPEVNSEFRGQEKLAEALKDKQPAKKPEQAGKIARVVRPGYRYVIDDENYRIVRTAQVKLYG